MLSLLKNLPVPVLRGPNRGYWWTLYPWSSYWRGVAYEADAVRAITRWVEPGQVCYDLGAHFGYYTLLMARCSGPTGKVVSFEPEPYSFAKLKRHLRLNRLEGRCLALNAAASADDGRGAMFKGGGPGATTTHFRYIDEPEFGEDKTLFVNTVRMDSLIESGKIAHPAFLKIDVEGHAVSALRGAEETIRHSKPVLFVSTHGKDEAQGLADFLLLLGYRGLCSLSGDDWSVEKARADEGVVFVA